jgi:hypothetical protein
MKPHSHCGQSALRFRLLCWAARGLCAVTIAAFGCKSDLNQQLLERELRYQEDQIYQLQDQLQEKCARLDYAATENETLRKQLGVSAADNPSPAARSGRGRSPAVPPAATVPPAVSLPDAPSFQPSRGAAPPANPGPPASLTPPTLEGVPPLPDEPGRGTPSADAGEGLSLPPPATASIDPSARPIETADEQPALVQMSYEEPAGQGPATRLVVNRSAAAAIDTDGNGTSEGITLLIEPRDTRERLAALPGDLTVTAFDTTAATGGPPLARWSIPAAEAATRFRPTGRRRGLFLELPWQGAEPAGDHIRLEVQAASPAGPLTAEAVIAIR